MPTRFEIGQTIVGESQLVFAADCLSDCLKHWEDQGYSKDEGYFIDIWEQSENGEWYPLADIKIENWNFKQRTLLENGWCTPTQ